MGFFGKIKEGLKKTRDSISNGVNGILNSFTKIDDELFEELEETLVMADVGVQTSTEICDRLRKKIKETGVTDPKEIKGMMKEIISENLSEDVSTSDIADKIGISLHYMCHLFKKETGITVTEYKNSVKISSRTAEESVIMMLVKSRTAVRNKGRIFSMAKFTLTATG